MSIKYVHTNIVAKDWKRLADFYIKVFDCTPVYPERNLSGEWLEKLTQIEEVQIKGIHLSLPGYENGPTLEIFQYDPEKDKVMTQDISQQGIAHIAFHVDDVEQVLASLLQHGGKQLGELVKKEMEGIGLLTAVYTEDPEGNFIEIQNWKRDI